MTYQNHNIVPGEETTDADVCNGLGLPIELAGTEEINLAAINKMRGENVKGYLERGFSQSDANSMANEKADMVRARLKQ